MMLRQGFFRRGVEMRCMSEWKQIGSCVYNESWAYYRPIARSNKLTDKSQHGGNRPGAGRKFAHGEETTSIQVRVPNSLLARIDNDAASKDISRNQIIVEALQASKLEQ
jgi:predicted DNA binding CopG/RHH family protein